MMVDPKEAKARGPAERRPPEPRKAPGFAALAKRISSWTSKGLASALVLVAGLAFGTQVLQWWRADKDSSDSPVEPVAAADGLGDPAREHHLRFGDNPWSMTRRTVAAAKPDALAMLRATCAESIRSGDALPATVWDDFQSRPTAAEQQWLIALAGRQPVQQESGRWALYELEEPNLMVVGTRSVGKEEGGRRKEEIGAASPRSSFILPPSSFPSGSRVVTWGLAIPGEGSQWTLYTLQWTPSSGGEAGPSEDIPIPSGSARILSVRATGGGAMVSFRGPPDVEAWKRFFDSWVSLHHWRAVGPWRQYGLNWHLHCEKDRSAQGGTMDLHFGPDTRGGQSGLVVLVPPAGHN
jgi:hypothetical protein